VVFGESGILASLRQGSVHVSCSTISVALSQKLTAATKAIVRALCPVLSSGARKLPNLRRSVQFRGYDRNFYSQPSTCLIVAAQLLQNRDDAPPARGRNRICGASG
jgi:hypothetical protein